MSPEAEDLYRKVMSLPEDVRRDVVYRLWARVRDDAALEGDGFDPSAADAWDAEVARRVREIDAGEVEPIPGEQVTREMNEMVERLRKNAGD